jgi:hypothetical protein
MLEILQPRERGARILGQAVDVREELTEPGTEVVVRVEPRAELRVPQAPTPAGLSVRMDHELTDRPLLRAKDP